MSKSNFMQKWLQSHPTIMAMNRTVRFFPPRNATRKELLYAWLKLQSGLIERLEHDVTFSGFLREIKPFYRDDMWRTAIAIASGVEEANYEYSLQVNVTLNKVKQPPIKLNCCIFIPNKTHNHDDEFANLLSDARLSKHAEAVKRRISAEIDRRAVQQIRLRKLVNKPWYGKFNPPVYKEPKSGYNKYV